MTPQSGALSTGVRAHRPNRREWLTLVSAGALAALAPRGALAQARRLLLVHGRDQQGQDPDALKQTWLDALSRGAAAAGLAVPAAIDVAFPYYGDVLDGLSRNLPLTSDIRTRGDATQDEFLLFQAQVADAVKVQAGVTDAEVNAEYGSNPRERGPLNWEWVQAILRAIDKHGAGLSGATLEIVTRDVFLYTRRAGVRDEIDAIVRGALTDEPTVVVAHSLGTVVAYNVLRSDPRQLRIPMLVTVGSPLGVRAIRDSLVPLRSPASVAAWQNAYDDRDVVALYPLDGTTFPIRPAVVNYGEVQNHTSNRHGIVGYLDDSHVARSIVEALGGIG